MAKRRSKVVTFDDLEEDVITVIISVLNPTERTAYHRINMKVGRSCQTAWNQEKILGLKSVPKANRFEVILKCPNLVYFNKPDQSILQLQ